jgi:hypothetical protein
MPQAHRKSRSPAAGLSRMGFWLRVLLLLAGWQGPLPWCHCHDTLAHASAPALEGHLRSHHPSVSLLADVCLGWHIHAALPGAPSDDPTQPQIPRQFRQVAVSSGETITPPSDVAEQWFPMADLGLQVDHAFAAEVASRAPVTQFFSVASSSAPLLTQFCVARC